MRILKALGVLVGCLSLTVPAMAPAFAAQQQNRAGKPTGKARSSVNKPANKPASVNRQQAGNANRSGGNYTKPNQKKVTNQQAYKAGQASSNRNKKDVVVVNPGGGGYYDNGRYYDNNRYDDDDDDFLEFVGKTAAITAGVSAVAAVIGSVSNDKPSGCQPVVSGGVQYQLCDGVYYQQIQQGGQPAYQVVAPPAQ
jgi:hypothetical protein